MKNEFNKDKFLTNLNEVLILCGIAGLVIVLWQLIELIVLKEIRPNDVDSIIAMILTFSLYGNYKFLQTKLRYKKEND